MRKVLSSNRKTCRVCTAAYDLIMEAGGRHETPTPQAPNIQPQKGLLSSVPIRWGVILALGTLFIGNRPEDMHSSNIASSPALRLTSPGEDEPSPEEIRGHIDAIAGRCISCCSATDLIAFSSLPRDHLAGKDISGVASQVSPQVRSEMHKLVEILSVKPEYAPYALSQLRTSLAELNITDPRKYACLFMDESMRLGDDQTIQAAASGFLKEESECGMYRQNISTTEITAIGKH